MAAETTADKDTRLQQMRDRLAAETTEEIPGLNVTEQDMGTTDCSVATVSFSVAFHPSQDAMQTWLHLIYQCYASLVSRLFLVP